MLVHIWCAPTWRFHTELCKFLRNISPNICGLGERTDLKLGEVSSLFIFNRITISWLYPLNGFRFIFLLCDSENDLFFLLAEFHPFMNFSCLSFQLYNLLLVLESLFRAYSFIILHTMLLFSGRNVFFLSMVILSLILISQQW